MESLRVLVAEIIPIVVLFVFATYERWLRTQRRERPPVQEKLLRTPGYTLGRKIEEIQDSIATWLVATVASALYFAFVLMRPDTKNPSADTPILVILAVAAAICTVMITRKMRDLRKFRFGLLGEQVVAEQLQNLASYLVFHDIPGDGKWNVDHVAVGPGGVFAIETKCRAKKISRNELREQDAVFDGNIIRFPWCEDRNAAAQARRNAKWIGDMLTKAIGERVTVQSIVALPGWWVTLTANSDVRVLNGKQIPGYINSQPAILSPKRIQQISHQLEQRCRDVEF
jgi:hypothetical protein